MLDFKSGLAIGVGVWVLAIFTATMIRSLGALGAIGMLTGGKMFSGWLNYIRGNIGDTVNVTLNTVKNGKLTIDTLVADRLITVVWPNIYLAWRLKKEAKECTELHPVIILQEKDHGKLAKRFGSRPSTAVSHFIYGPLISLIAESCANDYSIDLALGIPMFEHRFVVALTYEKLSDMRLQHFRAMVVLEQELVNWPDDDPAFDKPEHATRMKTLRKISQLYKENPADFGIVNMWRPV